MRLASRQAELTAGGKAVPVLEIRRLCETGHQTSIIFQRLESDLADLRTQRGLVERKVPLSSPETGARMIYALA